MIEIIFFTLKNYLTMLSFVIAFFGYGKLWQIAINQPTIKDKILNNTLQITAGMGVFIIFLKIIGIIGYLNQEAVAAMTIAGILLSFAPKKNKDYFIDPITDEKKSWNIWYYVAAATVLIAIILQYTLHKPLNPPARWDDIMYHLPHVREWMINGKISINEWIRYPYFPYNFNLLYAATMLISHEQNSNLMHALAGWLTAILLFRTASNNYGPIAATISAAVWISVSEWFFDTSYIDLGTTLFVFAGTICFTLWIQSNYSKPPLLITSAFFLGLAAGTKYQAIIYLPLFILAALPQEKRPIVWIKASLAFLIPCIYWFIRNTILTGNPVTPLAGSIFGYFDWNEGDFIYQMQDLKNQHRLPPWQIWLALLALAIPAAWRNNQTRFLIILSIYTTAIWYATSKYDRYLLPQYPTLALLGAFAITKISSIIASHSVGKEKIISAKKSAIIGKAFFLLALSLMLFKSIPNSIEKFRKIPVTAADRHLYTDLNSRHFAIMNELSNNFSDQKIYQIGLEGGIFFGPRPIYGDHFGKWRYSDYFTLSPKELNEKLIQEGFSILAADKNAVGIMEKQEGFRDFFKIIKRVNEHTIYQVIEKNSNE